MTTSHPVLSFHASYGRMSHPNGLCCFHEVSPEQDMATKLMDCCCWLCLFCLQGSTSADIIKVSASPLQFLIGNGPNSLAGNPYFSAGVIA